MTRDQDVRTLADHLERAAVELHGGIDRVEPPRGYAHLTLAVIDSVWSLQAQYPAVENVLRRYAAGVDALSGPSSWWLTAAGQPGFNEHDLTAFLERCGELHGTELADALFGKRARTPGARTLKADAAREGAERLTDNGVVRSEQLRNLATVERPWRSVPGLGDASWRYLLNLSGVEKVKPDQMIIRFVNAALPGGTPHPPTPRHS